MASPKQINWNQKIRPSEFYGLGAHKIQVTLKFLACLQPKTRDRIAAISRLVSGAGQFSNSLFANLDEFNALKESLKREGIFDEAWGKLESSWSDSTSHCAFNTSSMVVAASFPSSFAAKGLAPVISLLSKHTDLSALEFTTCTPRAFNFSLSPQGILPGK